MKDNNYYSDGVTVLLLCGKRNKNIPIIDNPICIGNYYTIIRNHLVDISIETVDDAVLDFSSYFRIHYGEKFQEAYNKLILFFQEMERFGEWKFDRGYIMDIEMRDVLDETLKKSNNPLLEFCRKINDRDVVIIVDPDSKKKLMDIIFQLRNMYSYRSLEIVELS